MTARKVMLLGEIGVGKSSLVRRLVFDRFDITYKPTIGVDVYRYDVPESPGRERLTLIVWDTDGNFGNAIFRHVYMKEAAGAVIVADVSRPATLEQMAKLARGFREALPGRSLMLALNKIDLIENGEMPEPPEIGSAPRLPCHVTSALDGTNVSRIFNETADAILRRKL